MATFYHTHPLLFCYLFGLSFVIPFVIYFLREEFEDDPIIVLAVGFSAAFGWFIFSILVMAMHVFAFFVFCSRKYREIRRELKHRAQINVSNPHIENRHIEVRT